MGEPHKVQGLKGILVLAGLGTPIARAFTAASVGGVALYATGTPSAAFDEEGEMRPFKLLSASPHATYQHFLLYPLAIGAAAYVLT